MKKRTAFFTLLIAATLLISLLISPLVKAEPEQSLTLSLGTEPDSLDVARTTDSYSITVLAQIMESLTRIETDEEGNTVVAPAAAESWEASEDGLEWTFTLREMQWEDGEEVTAHHFELGSKRILDPEVASPSSSQMRHIKNATKAAAGEVDLDEVGIKALDDKTLQITLEYPVPYFLDFCSGRLINAQREDVLDEFGSSYGTEAENLLCTGPFKVEGWIHNNEIALVKNENYWDADSVKLDRLVFKIIQEETALMGEFTNENIDIIQSKSLEWIELLEAEEKYTRISKPLARTSYFFFNQEVEPFNNVKVRQAFSIALDREEMSNVLDQGLTIPAYGWCAPIIVCDGENFREAAGEPIQDFAAEHDARELLVEGLKELGLSEDPADLSVTLMYPDNQDRAFVEYLQQRFQEVLGVNVELDPDEWPVFQERNRQLEYEFGFKSWGAGQNDPSEYLNLWMTGNKIVPIAWSNEEYDALVVEANESLDSELRMKNFVEAERILLIEDAAIAPFSYQTSNTFIQPYVKGLMFPDFASIVYKYAYIEK